MKRKIFSVLIASLMLLAACFAMLQASAATEGEIYTYYVGGESAVDNGSANFDKGRDPAAPLASVARAVTNAKMGTFQPGDKIEIRVSGQVWAHGEGKKNSNFLAGGSQSSFWAIYDTAGNPVPVTVRGTTGPETDAVRFYTSGATDPSCRLFATVNFAFEDLSFKMTGSGVYCCISAHIAELSFDNVIFDDSGFAEATEGQLATLGGHNGWVIDGGIVNNAALRAAGNPAAFAAKVTFKNGDYSNVKVAAAGSQHNSSVINVGTEIANSGATYQSSSTELVIGDGATMGTVIGVGQSIRYDQVTVRIEDDPNTPAKTTVDVFDGVHYIDSVSTGFTVYGDYDITIDGATVNTFNGMGNKGVLAGGKKLTVTVEDGSTLGSFYATNNEGVGTLGDVEVNINGGNFPKGLVVSGSVRSSNYYYRTNLTLNISGGTFGSIVTATRRANNCNYKSVTVNISGGEFSNVVCAVPYGDIEGKTTLKITGNPTFSSYVLLSERATLADADLIVGEAATPAKPTPPAAEQPTFKGGVALAAPYASNSTQTHPSSISGQYSATVYYGNFEKNFSGGNLHTESAMTIGSASIAIHGGRFYGVVSAIAKANVEGDVSVTVDGGHFGVGYENINTACFYAVGSATVDGAVTVSFDSNSDGTSAPLLDGRYFGLDTATVASYRLTVGRALGEKESVPAVVPTFQGAMGGNRCAVTGAVENLFYYGTFRSDVNCGNDSTAGVGSITNTFYGGLFEAGVAAQRGQGSIDGAGLVNGNVTTTVYGGIFDGQFNFGGAASSDCAGILVAIHGGTFNDVVRLAGIGSSDSVNATIADGSFSKSFSGAEAGTVTGSLTITFNGGTFNGEVQCYAGGTVSSVTSNVYGGTFNRAFYAGSKETEWGGESGNNVTVTMLLRPKSDVTFKSVTGEPGALQQKGLTAIQVQGDAGYLCLGTNAYTIQADSFIGTTPLKVKEISAWTAGKAYLWIAGDYTEKLSVTSQVDQEVLPFITKGNHTVNDSEPFEATFVFSPARLLGAGFVLTDRITTRLYFAPINSSSYRDYYLPMPYTLKVGDWTETGTLADLVGDVTYVDGVKYYHLELPSMKASDFHETISFSGFGNSLETSIVDIAANGAEFYKDQNPALAKTLAAIHNYAIASCLVDPSHDCTWPADPYLAGADAELNKVSGAVSVKSGGWVKFHATNTNYTMYINPRTGEGIARSLSLSDTIAVKYYVYARKGGPGSGAYNVTADLFHLKINGEVVDKSLYRFEPVTVAGTNYNFTFTLHLNASFMTSPYTLEIFYDQSTVLATVTDSVALACKSYISQYSGQSVGVAAEKALAYAQAVNRYNAVNGTIVILNQRRETAYNTMLEMMGGFLWSPSEEVTYYVIGTNDEQDVPDIDVDPGLYDDPNSYVNKITFYPDRVYSGMPYTHGGGSLYSFRDIGTQQANGVWKLDLTSEMLTGRSSGYEGQYSRFGNDCSDAVFWAWASISNSIDFAGPAGMCDQYGVVKVGDYKTATASSLLVETLQVAQENGTDVMYAAYRKLQRADALVHKPASSSGHVLMVDHLELVYNADGSINPTESRIHCLEQSRLWLVYHDFEEGDSKYKEDCKYYDETLKTWVWRVGVPELSITFRDAYDKGYLPVTCLELVDPSLGREQATFTDSVKNRTLDNLFTGTITTNYRPAYLTITVENENGTVVQDLTVYGKEGERMVFDMSRIPNDILHNVTHSKLAPFDPDSLGKGTYTVKGYMQVSNGEKLEVFDFSFEK